jgi:hypothetical protein
MNFANKEETIQEYERYDDLTDIKYCFEIIKKIEEKFSEYLNTYEKEWESLENRNKWVL